MSNPSAFVQPNAVAAAVIAGPSSSSSSSFPNGGSNIHHASTSATPIAGGGGGGGGPSSSTGAITNGSGGGSGSAVGSSSPAAAGGRVMSAEVQQQILATMTPSKMQNIMHKANQLRSAGWTEQTSPDLASLCMVIRLVQADQAQKRAAIAAAAAASAPASAPPPMPATTANGASAGGASSSSNVEAPGAGVAAANVNGNGSASAAAPSSGAAGAGSPTAAAAGAAPQQQQPPPPRPMPPNMGNMTPQQLAQLRTQVYAFQQLSQNRPIPPHIQQAVMGQPPQLGQPEGMEAKLIAKTAEVLMNAEEKQQQQQQQQQQEQQQEGSQASKEVTPAADEASSAPQKPWADAYAMEYDESSVIFPYNAFSRKNPSTYLYRPAPEAPFTNTKFQRTIVPSELPKGLDPYLQLEERNRRIEARQMMRIKWLEEQVSHIGAYSVGGKPLAGITDVNNGVDVRQAPTSAQIKLINELRMLRLRDKQKLMREDHVRGMNAASTLPSDRTEFRRSRSIALRDAKTTEALEREQRALREKQSKQAHNDYVQGICEHGRQLVSAGARAKSGAEAIGKWILRTHKDTEKEEAKRIERLSKERLKALKADDEDGYRALIDQAKDTRITHLLKRTDAYLDSLADQIKVQKRDVEGGGLAPGIKGAASLGDDSNAAMEEGEDGKLDYLAVTHQVKESVTKQASMLTGGTLKSYQIQGLEWMVSLYNNRLNGILADEMGLGKTIQTLSLITYLIEKKQENGPYLVLVPLSTLTNWTSEFKLWAPTVKTLVLKGDKASRKLLADRVKRCDFQVLLTTYEYVIKEAPALSKIKWHHMIIDEGHRMKNAKSKLSTTLNEKYSTKYRIILTGTPLQNNIPELWALLNFVLPKVFNSAKSFDEWFNAPFAGTGSEAAEMTEEEKLLVVKGLHKVLRPFLLRRLKKDVEAELPEKVEKIIKVKMSGLQSVLYKHMKEHGRLIQGDDTKNRADSLQNMIIQLRKICQHPFVFDAVETDIDQEGIRLGEYTRAIWRTAGKFELLDRILPKLFAGNHKCLIFFQWTSVMDQMEHYLQYRKIDFCRLDGSTKAEDRQTLLSTFNDRDSPYKVFLLSTRAGGLGLNLQSADTVIIYDSDYNPHADLQAQDRAHRIGQKKEVRVFRLVTSGSVEEGIIEVAKRKLALDGQVIQAGKFDGHTSAEERDNFLRSLLERGEDDPEEDAEPDEDTLNEILARGDDELELFQRMDAERPAKDAAELGDLPRLIQLEELPPAYQRKYEKVVETDQYDPEESGRGQRKRTTVNYGDNDEDFWKAIEGGDSDDDDDDEEGGGGGPGRKRTKPKSSAANSKQSSQRPSPAPSDAPRQKKSGRSRLQEITADDDDDDESVGGRKRGRPEASIDGDEPTTKRPKVGGRARDADVASVERVAMTELWQAVVGAQWPETGDQMSDVFRQEVPRDIPGYYDIIKKPMWLDKIKRNIPKYRDLRAFKQDMEQVFINARLYNLDDSLIYIYADTLDKIFKAAYEQKLRELGYNENGEPDEKASSAGTPSVKVQGGGGGGPKLKFKVKSAAPVAPTPSPGRRGGKSSNAKGRGRRGRSDSDEEASEEEARSSGMEE